MTDHKSTPQEDYSEIPNNTGDRVSPTPRTELDFQMQTTDPKYGYHIPAFLKDRLTNSRTRIDTQVEKHYFNLDQVEDIINDLVTKKGFTKAPYFENTFVKVENNRQYFVVLEKKDNQAIFTTKTSDKVIVKDAYWEILAMYTRDMRLGFLEDGSNPFKPDEVEFVEYHLNLAMDYLRFEDDDCPNGLVEPAIVHIIRAATKIEVSHSKRGNLRKQQSTVSSEVKYEGIPPDQNVTRMMGAKIPGVGRQ